MPHALSGKWILHYFCGDIPWRTISDLPEDEALEINRPTGKTSGLCPISGKDLIYQHRLSVEAWDRSQHLERGGRMDNPNPVYAVLSNEEHPFQPYRPGNCLTVPAEEIPTDVMSISFGDSFPNHTHRKSGPLAAPGSRLGRSYSAEEFTALVKDEPFPTQWPSGYNGPEGFCVEVRFYTRALPLLSRPSPLQGRHYTKHGHSLRS